MKRRFRSHLLFTVYKGELWPLSANSLALVIRGLRCNDISSFFSSVESSGHLDVPGLPGFPGIVFLVYVLRLGHLGHLTHLGYLGHLGHPGHLGLSMPAQLCLVCSASQQVSHFSWANSGGPVQAGQSSQFTWFRQLFSQFSRFMKL